MTYEEAKTLTLSLSFDVVLMPGLGNLNEWSFWNDDSDIAPEALFIGVMRAKRWAYFSAIGWCRFYDRFLELEREGKLTIQRSELKISESASAQSEEEVIVEMLEKPVAELNLSVRVVNCMECYGIRTVRDLVVRSEKDMLEMKNFGEKQLQEVREILHSMDIDFGMTQYKKPVEDLSDLF